MKKPYQGHESWNAWNVSLWILNDYGMYQAMRGVFKLYGKSMKAAKRLKSIMPTRTPDGAPISVRSCYLVLQSEEV